MYTQLYPALSMAYRGETGHGVCILNLVQKYENVPEQPAPGPAGGRVTYSRNRTLPNNFPGKLHNLYIRLPGKLLGRVRNICNPAAGWSWGALLRLHLVHTHSTGTRFAMKLQKCLGFRNPRSTCIRILCFFTMVCVHTVQSYRY